MVLLNFICVFYAFTYTKGINLDFIEAFQVISQPEKGHNSYSNIISVFKGDFG